MFKKILVLGVVSFAFASAACTMAPGSEQQPAAETSTESAALTSSPGTYACTSSSYCECHDAVGCAVLGGKCTLYCSQRDSSGNCVDGCCIVTQISSPTRLYQAPATSGTLYAH